MPVILEDQKTELKASTQTWHDHELYFGQLSQAMEISEN